MWTRWDKFSEMKKLSILIPMLGVTTMIALYSFHYIGKMYDKIENRINNKK